MLEKLTLFGLKTDNKLEAEQNCIIRNFMIHSLQICYMIQSGMRCTGNMTHIRDKKYSDTPP